MPKTRFSCQSRAFFIWLYTMHWGIYTPVCPLLAPKLSYNTLTGPFYHIDEMTQPFCIRQLHLPTFSSSLIFYILHLIKFSAVNSLLFCIIQQIQCFDSTLTEIECSPSEPSVSTKRDRPKSATLQSKSSLTKIFLAAKS